jgi:hypothetical protein
LVGGPFYGPVRGGDKAGCPNRRELNETVREASIPSHLPRFSFERIEIHTNLPEQQCG